METMEVTNHEQEIPARKSKKFKFRVTRQQIVQWLIANPLDLLLILMVLVGIILAINPLPNVTGADRLIRLLPAAARSSALNGVQWLTYDGGAQISGSIFFILGAGIGIWRTRQHVFNNRDFWSTNCPSCFQENTLKRVHRTQKDKLWNVLFVPVRRYRCKNCRWKGLRLDENLV